MAQSASVTSIPAIQAQDEAVAASGRIPWYVWCYTAAITFAVIGAVWDISWHKSIGRDTFWTPAHIAIYLCGIVAGLTSAWLILNITFGRMPELREASVSLWGFRGPLGAFIAAWGAIAMISSAPFDDWWHNAYGLDVKILSPPHVVLILGILSIRVATLLLVLGLMNRASGKLRERLVWLFLYAGTVLLSGTLGAFQERTFQNYMHTGAFYVTVASVTPVLLTAVAAASGHRWGATIMAAFYSLLICANLWIFPLFPAEPKLGPVFQPVTHFIPNPFPLLIVVPAVAIDVLRARVRGWSLLRQSIVIGAAFLGSFALVQWPFANFLMSPAARNWFFGAHYFPYFLSSDTDLVAFRFTVLEGTAAHFSRNMFLALAAAVVSTRAGLSWARWLGSVKR